MAGIMNSNGSDLSELRLHYLQKNSRDEWSSECPRCGGEPHRNGELPDRFRIFLKSRATGGMLGWCRQCGYIWVPHSKQLTPTEHKNWIEERRQIEQIKLEKTQLALSLLHHEKVWLEYHENLIGGLRQFYYDRKITDWWIDYWMLGYNPDKIIWTGTEEYHTPTMTIPVYKPGEDKPINLRNRLLNPPKAGDKYRPELSGLPASLYYTNREELPRNKVLIVEGEYKAMTTSIVYDDFRLPIVGLPGKTPSLEILESLDQCEVVYLLLDPDAYIADIGKKSPLIKLAEHFGKRARICYLPHKIDDMIVKGIIGKDEIGWLLRDARRYIA